MIAATKVKMSGSVKKNNKKTKTREQEHKQHFLHKTCN